MSIKGSARVMDQQIVARLDFAANELDKIGALSLPTLVRQAASEIQHAADHIDAQTAKIKALVDALTPFCFFDEDDPEEDLGYAWMIRRGDRFKDWVDYHDIGEARAALAAAKEPT